MPAKPKIAKLDVEKIARRLQSHFPGAANFYTVTYPMSSQKENWEPGDKFEIGYKRVPTKVQSARGTPGSPAPISAYIDHIEGRAGIVVPLCDVATMTTRWGAVDIDVYDNPDKLKGLVNRVMSQGLHFTSHLTKSGGLRILFKYSEPVSVVENSEVIRGLGYKVGYAGLMYETFPPVQVFNAGVDPKQLNLPFFGDKYHAIKGITFDEYRFFTLDQWLDRAEQYPLDDWREYYIDESRKHPRSDDRKAAKANRRRANTDLQKGQAYAKHWLGVYVKKLENSVEGMSIEVRPGAKEIAGRNDAIAVYAYHLGQMAARDWLTESDVLVALENATIGWRENSTSRDKTRETMRRQFAKGMLVPHDDLANKVFMTEDLAAIEFVELYRDRIRYDIDIKQYLVWNEKLGYWAPDKLLPVFETIRDFLREQVVDEPPKVQARTVTKTFISAVEWHVRNSSVILVDQRAWDRDPLLLGAPECTIDLRTGEARTPVRGEHISKITTVAPSETDDCPTWKNLIYQATCGNEEYARFLQIVLGYCLIGDNREQKLFFLWGSGGNAKDLVLGTVGKILGDVTSGTGMHFPAPIGMFTASQNAKPTYDLASARHARLLTNDENATDKFWDEEFIKMLTGNSRVSARALYQNNVSFTPGFTPAFAGQSLPRLKNPDWGMRRRILICPFEMRVTDDPEEVDEAAWVFLKDVGLGEKLDAELSSILRWLVIGALMYHEQEFHHLPAVVSEATDDFFYAEDHLGRFMDSHFERTKNPTDRVSVSDAYDSYKFVMEQAGQFAEPQGQFTKKLKQLHRYETVKLDGYAVFVRLRRRKAADRQPPDELPI